jgi:hypothetical protein
LAQKSLLALRICVPILRPKAGTVTREEPSSKKSEFFCTRATRVLHGQNQEEQSHQDHQEKISSTSNHSK